MSNIHITYPYILEKFFKGHMCKKPLVINFIVDLFVELNQLDKLNY